MVSHFPKVVSLSASLFGAASAIHLHSDLKEIAQNLELDALFNEAFLQEPSARARPKAPPPPPQYGDSPAQQKEGAQQKDDSGS